VSDPVAIVLADDHPLFRKGLADVIGAEPGFRIVGQAGDGETALELVRFHRPGIAVLDIEMPRANGLLVAEAIRREGLAAQPVILTMHQDAGMLHRALESGARGYLLKDSAVTDIVACLHMVASGRAYISPALSTEMLEGKAGLSPAAPTALASLTPAERRVLALIAQGQTSAAIARQLSVSVKTIENHRSHICRKLGLSGPQALLRFALSGKGKSEVRGEQ
jgi:DNA-binding NarL/FixJ family response regulator